MQVNSIQLQGAWVSRTYQKVELLLEITIFKDGNPYATKGRDRELQLEIKWNLYASPEINRINYRLS